MDQLLDKKAEFQFDIAFQEHQYRVVVTYYNANRGNRQWSTYLFDGGIPRWRVNFGRATQYSFLIDRSDLVWDRDTDPSAPNIATDVRDQFLDAVQASLNQLS
jgi:hypothetical protein